MELTRLNEITQDQIDAELQDELVAAKERDLVAASQTLYASIDREENEKFSQNLLLDRAFINSAKMLYQSVNGTPFEGDDAAAVQSGIDYVETFSKLNRSTATEKTREDVQPVLDVAFRDLDSEHLATRMASSYLLHTVNAGDPIREGMARVATLANGGGGWGEKETGWFESLVDHAAENFQSLVNGDAQLPYMPLATPGWEAGGHLKNAVAGLVKGIPDAAQGVLDLGHDIDNAHPMGKIVWGRGNGLEWIASDDPGYTDMPTVQLPQFAHGDSGVEETARVLGHFLTVFAVGGGLAGTMARGVAAGALADATFNPEMGNLSTMLEEMGIKWEVIELLNSQVGEDATAEERLRARGKNAIEGALLSVVIEPLIMGIKAARNMGAGPALEALLNNAGEKWKALLPPPGQLNMGIGTTVTPENIKSLVKRYPTAKSLIPYMTEREIQLLDRPRMQGRINTILEQVKEFERLGLSQEIQSVALAGAAKKGWYKASSELLGETFGEDFPRFAALLAATSPQTSVKSNLKNALNVWKNWTAAGRPTDENTINRIFGESVEGNKGDQSVLDAWRKNTLTALTEGEDQILLSGGKVDSFMRNIMGDSESVTLDTWMANYFGISQKAFDGGGKNLDIMDPGFSAKYQATSIIVRKGAAKLSERTGQVWTPAEIQETVWSYVKTATEMRRNGDPRTIDQIIKSGEITDDLVRGTDDFATILGADDIGGILKGTTYGQRLSTALEGSNGTTSLGIDAAAQGTRGGVGAKPGHLERLGQRLERGHRSRSAAGVIGQLRKSLDLSTSSRLDGGETGGVGSVKPDNVRSSSRHTQPFSQGNRYYSSQHLGRYRVYRPSPNVASKLNDIGKSTPAVNELETSAESAAIFRQKVLTSKASTPYGAAVYVYDAAEYAGMRLFVTKDGTAGFALKGDDIVSVFNDTDGPHDGVTANLLLLAVQMGGRKLDAYDTVLPRIYTESGFRPVSRVTWSDADAPPDWNKETFAEWNNGEPDVVFFAYDPDYIPTAAKPYSKSHGERPILHGPSAHGEGLDYGAAYNLQSTEVARLFP